MSETKHFVVTLDMGLTTYDVDADSEESAVDTACEWYEERSPEILHVNRPENDSISNQDVTALRTILEEILEHAKDEAHCTDAENAFLAECQNMKEACAEYTASVWLKA